MTAPADSCTPPHPLDGMLLQHRSAYAAPAFRLGNDFTSTPGSRSWPAALARSYGTDGLHVDCRRDLRLAGEWGYPEGRPTIVLPGNGGIRPEVFFPPWDAAESRHNHRFLKPSGGCAGCDQLAVSAYVRQDVFRSLRK
jgi:hypothetical protein